MLVFPFDSFPSPPFHFSSFPPFLLCLVQGLTQNQARLLYMISLYSHAARSEQESEEWLRKTALLVLIYEGVVAQVRQIDTIH